MELKDIWEDLQDKVAGDENSGSKITVTPINNIAHSVIKNEENILELENKSEPFYVTFTTQDDSDEDVTITNIDKTFAETLNAYNEGRKVVGIFNGDNSFMNLVYKDDGTFVFSCARDSRITTISFYDVEDGTKADIYETFFMPDYGVEDVPLEGSTSLITSGGVYNALEKPLKPFVITLEEDCESITLDENDIKYLANLGDMYITFLIPKTATTATSSQKLYIHFNETNIVGAIASWCHKDYVLRATLYSTKVNDFRYVISSTQAGANGTHSVSVGALCNLVNQTTGLPQNIVSIDSIKIKTSDTNLLIPKGTVITIGGYVK